MKMGRLAKDMMKRFIEGDDLPYDGVPEWAGETRVTPLVPPPHIHEWSEPSFVGRQCKRCGAMENDAPEPDDEDAGRRVIHYDPQMELIGQRAEWARLRDMCRRLIVWVRKVTLFHQRVKLVALLKGKQHDLQ